MSARLATWMTLIAVMLAGGAMAAQPPATQPGSPAAKGPTPASQPADADWKAIEANSDSYKRLVAAEVTLAGKLEGVGRPTPPSAPASYVMFQLVVGQRKIKIPPLPPTLAPFVGKQVEARCKPTDGKAAEATAAVRVGSIREVKAAAGAADPSAWQPVDGERPGYKVLTASEEVKQGILAMRGDRVRGFASGSGGPQLNTGESTFALIGDAEKLKPFDGRKVLIQCKSAGEGIVQVGFIKAARPLAEDNIGWTLVDGESPYYKSINTEELAARGVLTATRTTPNTPFARYFLRTADAGVMELYSDYESKLKEFENKTVIVKFKRSSPMSAMRRVGWIKLAG